tara:strand:- start:1167 stop:2039 length:873 start_codon:yes stop_codon:yes gene_type:complete
MAINFPTSPSTNDTHTHSGVTYEWDGTSWLAQGSTATYTLPTASSTVLGGIKVGNRLTINSGVLEADVQASTYGNSDVDTHLNQSNPTSGYVLSWNGSDYAWVDNAGYSNSDVDTHLNQSNPTSGHVLSWNGSDYAWTAQTGTTYSAGTGLSLVGTTFNVTSTYTSSRTTAAATTSSLADQASGNIDITAAKAYALLKIQTSHAAWVTLYTDTSSRTSDASRNITTDPLPGSGVIAEVLLSDGGVQKITPGLIGYNDDATPSTKVYAKVQNRSGSAATITVTLHYLALEG